MVKRAMSLGRTAAPRSLRAACALAMFAALPHAAAVENVAAWTLWLDAAPASPATPAPAFPGEGELAGLRANGAWLERWSAQAPSAAWNDVVGELVVKYQQNPLRAARSYTYVHAAIHDALVECARRGCESAVQPIAMHAAASRVLDHLYPGESPGRIEALGHSAAAAGLAASGPRPQALLAWRTGGAVAQAAIRRALYDGWDLPRLPAKRPAPGPGVWRAAPPINIYDPIEPYAGEWRTWVLKDGAELEPAPPTQFASAAYWAEVDEVYATWKHLTPAQKRIAEGWNLDAGSVTPPGVWNVHAKKLAQERNLDAAQAARLFSTLNAAMMDAFIACWHAKFKWWTERPVTIIREHRDKDFMPYIVTPGFPSYVSGHSSVSGAAATVLAGFFPESAPELKRMAQEAAVSRLYGGIHFASDNEAGLALGERIGVRALARLRAAAVPQFAEPPAPTSR
jgi:membrane-associated phospholipid phosphatase